MSNDWRDEIIKKQFLDTEQRNRELQKQAADEAQKSLFDPIVGLFPLMKRQDEEREARQRELMAEEQARQDRNSEPIPHLSEPVPFDQPWPEPAVLPLYEPLATGEPDRFLDLIGALANPKVTPGPEPRIDELPDPGRSQEPAPPITDRPDPPEFRPVPQQQRPDDKPNEPEEMRQVWDDRVDYGAMRAEERRDSLLASWSQDFTVKSGEPDSKEQEEQVETLRRMRAQEDQKEYTRADWSYWWDPVMGFWAWMKRQDEEREGRQRELMAEERAQQDRQAELQAEGQARQENRQELMAEPQGGSEKRFTDSDEPRPLRGEGVDYESMSSEERRESLLDSWETSTLPEEKPALEQQLRAQEGAVHIGADTQNSHHQRRNDGVERKAFREYVVETINAGCDGKDHPLRNLLDKNGKAYAARNMYDFDNPIFDAGHLVTRHGGGTALGVEWSADNRLDGVHSERKGIVIEKVFVDVKGIPIELGMLKTLENTGLVPLGTVEASKPSKGWEDRRTDR